MNNTPTIYDFLLNELNPVLDFIVRDLNIKCPHGGCKKRLCSNDCLVCFHKSFASHRKAKFWHPTKNGSEIPKNVAKNSSKKYWFKCDICKHDFDSSLDSINGKNNWCPYCVNKKRCNEEDCNHCYEKSFASHEKAKFWHPTKNESKTPRDVAKSSDKKYWFKCDVCKHNFDSSLDSINGMDSWCPYCVNKKRCEEEDCDHCYKKSFASHEKAKFWHPTKNESKTPRDVAKSSDKKYWFKCDVCKHNFDNSLDSINGMDSWCPYCVNKKRCEEEDCDHCYKKSFANHEKAKFWHPTKNGSETSRDVAKNDNNKYWFKCDVCKHNFDSRLSSINKGRWCPYCVNLKRCNEEDCNHCYEKSFASHEKAKFWHPTKNGSEIPRNVAKNDNEKYWFKCDVCKHDFDNSLGSINNGIWCSYCANKKRCNEEDCNHCYEKSFASHEKAKFWHPTKNGSEIPRNVAKNDNEKYWFKCDVCKHDFDNSLGSINGKNTWCPYCVNLKRCEEEDCTHCYKKSFASHEKAKFWHPTKNGSEMPRNVAKSSGDKYWFKCDICKHDFDSALNNINGGKWCPICKNKTERKLYNFLIEKFSKEKVQREAKFKWCNNPETNKQLPFDFLIEELKIIIELDGAQHFRQVSNWKSPEITQERDKYKMTQANEQGYTVIRLLQEDVWDDKTNWKELLIKDIKLYDKPKCIFISEGGEYEYY